MIDVSTLDNAKKDVQFFAKHLRGFLALAEVLDSLSAFQKEINSLETTKKSLASMIETYEKAVAEEKSALESIEAEVMAAQSDLDKIKAASQIAAKDEANTILGKAKLEAQSIVENAKDEAKVEEQKISDMKLESSELRKAIASQEQKLAELNKAIEGLRSKF